jgi:hypothetical protein
MEGPPTKDFVHYSALYCASQGSPPLAGQPSRVKYWSMRTVSAFGVLVASATIASAQAVDTMVTAQGFLQRDDQVGLWTIVVPLPLRAFGARTYVVPVVGEPERWSRFVNHYIEATGRVTHLPERGNPPIGMEIEKAKDVEPPGTGHATVDRGMTLHADITLSVIPNRFSWQDANGNESGVNPIALYTILNRRSTPIYFVLPTNDFLCITVKTMKDNIRTWDSTTQVPAPDARRFAVQRAGIFRDQIHIPRDAAPRPGRYVAFVGICAVDDYDVKTEFEIQ